MRKRKCRAWDKKRKVMFQVTTMDMDDSGQFPQRIEDGEPLRFIDRKDVELMDYINKKDKNGKEIYEGDIIKCDICFNDGFDPQEDEWLTKIVQIKWDEAHASFSNTMWSNKEIIGNIYENPELIKDEVTVSEA